ncbi:MAG: Gfo/Idh/MocA family oxidoreductase [Ruminococcaceae bacterium]|nr:Gfo/Idh/MocA family oxidoreductase [Oscillospiraceae bacterium]
MEKKKIRFGVFGLTRGNELIYCIEHSEAEVVAICDHRPAALAQSKDEWFRDRDVMMFENFDDFIKADFDAVLMSNYFCDHAEYSIRAMKAGKHVLSETLPNITMAEGVELCRVKEETGMTYALLENYPYYGDFIEMGRMYKAGTLGSLVYAEGSYIHPMSAGEQNGLAPGERHWRNWTPRTYYTTHALAPLMMMTDALPTKVTAMASFHPEITKGTALRTGDAAAFILCQTDINAVFRITGWAHYVTAASGNVLCGTRGSACVDPETGHVKVSFLHNDPAPYVKYVEWPDSEYGPIPEKAGHSGTDFYVINEFVKDLREGREPYFNVYRATMMSSVAILAWRSILNDNKCYDVPDFRKEEDRKKYENDRITPYPDENYRVNIPCSSQPHTPTEEDLETARRMWQNKDYLSR